MIESPLALPAGYIAGAVWLLYIVLLTLFNYRYQQRKNNDPIHLGAIILFFGGLGGWTWGTFVRLSWPLPGAVISMILAMLVVWIVFKK